MNSSAMYILFLDDAVHEGPPLDGPLSGLERHYKDRSKSVHEDG